MKKFILTLLLVLSCAALSAKGSQTVLFKTKLHCNNCVKKITENISVLKGVKDLDVSLDKQTVKVVFDPTKTSEEALAKEINSLGYPAVKVPGSAPAPGSAASATGSQKAPGN